jgi:urease accessory protein UreH
MENVAGIAVSAQSEGRSDSHGSIVLKLASLIQHIQQTNALIESAIIRAAAVADMEISATLVVLDDITPGYVKARAALKSCEAGLELALQSWTTGRRTV